jgi:putative ABC transport system substrate-binding protein
MRTRRRIILALGASSLAAPLALFAQQPEKKRRIGVLETVSAELNRPNLDAFRQGLREAGHVEGRSFVIEYRSAEGRPERFGDLAAELVRLNVDLILTRGTPATLAAKNATKTIPIVIANIGDPLLAVASLARPGGNITGLTSLPELVGKRVELLKEMFPGVANILVLINPDNLNLLEEWKEIETAARAMGIQSQRLDVRKSEDIARALDQVNVRGGTLMVGQDAVTQANTKLIIALAAKRRLPSVFIATEFVEAGGLIAYGASLPDLYRRAATYADKIFKGANPGDLPVEQPTTFELAVNLKTAKTLGIKIPQSILVRADKVIE